MYISDDVIIPWWMLAACDKICQHELKILYVNDA